MSTAIEIRDRNLSQQILPWYRYAWPWFLISFPLTSVILGIGMFYLALQTNNSLVVDDYYKQGKAINQRIEKDQQASLLGLAATLTPGQEGLLIELNRHLPAGLPAELQARAMTLQEIFVPPMALSLRWVHVTQAKLDGSARAVSIGGGRYIVSGLNLPETGHYRLHIQPETEASWRIVGPSQDFMSSRSIQVNATSADQIFNSSQWQ